MKLFWLLILLMLSHQARIYDPYFDVSEVKYVCGGQIVQDVICVYPDGYELLEKNSDKTTAH